MICEPNLLTGAFCLMHVTWYTFFILGERGGDPAIIMPKILVATVSTGISALRGLSTRAGLFPWINFIFSLCLNITFQDHFFSTFGVSHTFFDCITKEPLNVAVATGHTRCSGDSESEFRPSDRLFWLTVSYFFLCTGKLWNCGPAMTLT